MKKIMMILADGFEEIEALAVVDILRRAEVNCVMVGLSDIDVTGAHGIQVKCDILFDDINLSEYEGIILPGGMPGALNLKNNIRLTETVKDYHSSGRIVAAICAAPIVLEKAGIISGKQVTSYPSFRDDLHNSIYLNDIVAVDGNIITSRGPATAMSFAFEILKALDKENEVEALKEDMLFNIMF